MSALARSLVLEPFPQRRPYLAALVNDETIEEEQNYLAKEHKEKEEHVAAAELLDADTSFPEESVVDNPYLNPPIVVRGESSSDAMN